MGQYLDYFNHRRRRHRVPQALEPRQKAPGPNPQASQGLELAAGARQGKGSAQGKALLAHRMLSSSFDSSREFHVPGVGCSNRRFVCVGVKTFINRVEPPMTGMGTRRTSPGREPRMFGVCSACAAETAAWPGTPQGPDGFRGQARSQKE